MTLTPDAPQVWIGCLGCYNGGNLIGDWTDADEANDFEEHFTKRVKVPRSHHAEGHEEFWCMDHQGFHGLLKGECSPMEAQRLAELIAAIEGNQMPVDAVAAWASLNSETLVEWDRPTREKFTDSFAGKFDSEKDFAKQLVDETGWGGLNEIPDELKSYLDYDHIAHELMFSHNAEKVDGGVYIFRSI